MCFRVNWKLEAVIFAVAEREANFVHPRGGYSSSLSSAIQFYKRERRIGREIITMVKKAGANGARRGKTEHKMKARSHL